MIKNSYPGKFIVFEGLDGSGKSTQSNLLIKYLKRKGCKTAKIDFPQHGKKSSGLVDEYLTGKYGGAGEVGPYRAAIFYACDRYAASFKIRKWLGEGRVVVADRYMASNIGHQGGKIKNRAERKKFIKWLHNLEYKTFEIPKPDITFILKTSPRLSRKLAPAIIDQEKKKKRESYLGKKKRDIHERDLGHLGRALKTYLLAAREFPKDFEVIECLKKGRLLSPEIIHQKVLKGLKKITKTTQNQL